MFTHTQVYSVMIMRGIEPTVATFGECDDAFRCQRVNFHSNTGIKQEALITVSLKQILLSPSHNLGTLVCIAADAQATAHVKCAWQWLCASGLEVHITCANAYLQALLREVGVSSKLCTDLSLSFSHSLHNLA